LDFYVLLELDNGNNDLLWHYLIGAIGFMKSFFLCINSNCFGVKEVSFLAVIIWPFLATHVSFDSNFLYFKILFNINNRRILKRGGLTLSILYFRNVLLNNIHFQFLNQLAEFRLVGLNCGVQFFSKGGSVMYMPLHINHGIPLEKIFNVLSRRRQPSDLHISQSV